MGADMSDWKFLETKRVIAAGPRVPRMYVSDASYGFNGMFRFAVDTFFLRVIASDGGGWQHVSVTVEGQTKPPT